MKEEKEIERQSEREREREREKNTVTWSKVFAWLKIRQARIAARVRDYYIENWSFAHCDEILGAVGREEG